MWSLVKHLNICSSGGFQQSNALSKTFYFSVVKTSKHLFIWRFWTVRCFEQNIYISQVQKHLNIWSSVISKESCGHMEDYWWNIQTSIHLLVLNCHTLWTENLINQWWKHLNICSSARFKQSCDLRRKQYLVKHPNICSSGGFEQSYALSKTS